MVQSRDVTREVYWRSDSSRGNASVFLGLVQAHRPGMETLLVHIGSDDTYLEAQKEVLVMSDGTFALRGSLRDASSGRSISGATVSVVGSAVSTTKSGSDGSYVLWSVPPVADIAASLPGYRSKVQRVALADHTTRLDFALDEETRWHDSGAHTSSRWPPIPVARFTARLFRTSCGCERIPPS